MSSYQDLVDIFGKGNIATFKYDELRAVGVVPAAARVLSYVGIPRELFPVFAVGVVGEPDAFSLHDFEVEGEDVRVLILGGPPGDEKMRFFLEASEGFVGLFGFFDEGPQAEIINSTAEDFVEFLHLLGIFIPKLKEVSAGEFRECISNLSLRLRERDPIAFSEPDGWWSVVLARLEEQGGASGGVRGHM